MKESAYKKAGVDIDAGDALVERIREPVRRTNRAGVMTGLGGYGALFDLKEAGYKDPVLVSSTDGVGTKLRVAIEAGIHDTVGIDLVAMCVNDIVVMGAEPLFFLDYFASGKLDVDQAAAVIAGIAAGCREAGCALTGGETAEMPGMYAAGDYDLAGFAVGAVERNAIITGDSVKAGDIVLGLASSGVHSNGYSLVRKIVSDSGLSYDFPAPFAPGQTLGQALLAPTRIYVKPALEAVKKGGLRALAHITGGGLIENIPRVIPAGLSVRLDARSWEAPPVFAWLRKTGALDPHDMARTFNGGIGMVVICDAQQADNVAASLRQSGEKAFPIGRVEKGDGSVIIDNLEAAWK